MSTSDHSSTESQVALKHRPPLDIKFGVRVQVNVVGSRVMIEDSEDLMFLDVAGAYALRDWLNGVLP